MPRKKAPSANGASVTSPPTDLTTTAPVPTTNVSAETTQEKDRTRKTMSYLCRVVNCEGGSPSSGGVNSAISSRNLQSSIDEQVTEPQIK
mmetsp:Transcript_3707/g.8550  ORF Transcript_3707/g.8550 Transcript_3707/m.8550 type:complete len:90 (-) Transcript_3707:145-414(-)